MVVIALVLAAVVLLLQSGQVQSILAGIFA